MKSATQDGYRVQMRVSGKGAVAQDSTDLRFTVTNVGDTVAAGGVGGPVTDAPIIVEVTHPSGKIDRTSPEESNGGRYRLTCYCESPGTATVKVELHFAWVHTPPSPVNFWFRVPVRERPDGQIAPGANATQSP